MVADAHNARMLATFFSLELKMVMSLAPDPSINGPDPPQVRQHKKALICTLLDGLAAIYAPSASNRVRFQAFVTDFGGWPERDLVSVPILLARLEASGPPSPLAIALKSHLSKHSTKAGNSLPLSALDLAEAEVLAMGASGSEPNQIANSRHIRLLYVYRNFLVHEFRSPGYAMEAMATDPNAPYYHSYINTATWVLGYPLGFFHQLAVRGIDAFREYLIANGIDPYDRVKPTSLWN